jgi:predicted nucleotidyltransferase component of viral defense system
MITKAIILALAKEQDLEPQIIEKDYALGWLLYGIAQHPVLSRWRFKGGTCLKKCFFETYRFSEDLDFTVPTEVELTESSLRRSLEEVCAWVTERCDAIDFATERLDVELYANKQDKDSFRARVYYTGPLNLSRGNQQRIKLDLTQNEVLCDPADMRVVFHGYDDRIEPAPLVGCYSLNEFLAEKTRALYEREGRPRDVYDLVNIHRSFREEVDPSRAREIVLDKFAFKNLPSPTVQNILERVDIDVLRTAWEQQLTRQVPHLPPFESYNGELKDALAWWMEPAIAAPLPPRADLKPGETIQPRERFVATAPLIGPLGRRQPASPGRRLATSSADTSRTLLDRVRFAARNRLLAEIQYDGAHRIVEPYSLRYAAGTGNTHVFVYELSRNGIPTGETKRYDVTKLQSVSVTDRSFTPQWVVEL